MAAQETIHATCVVVGEGGVLIRGPSGAGKSSFARDLLTAARHAGMFARLVSDDRTRITVRAGRLLAQAPEAIAGRIEVRGVGILRTDYETSVVVRLVVDLSTDAPPRLPPEGAETIALCGVMVPRIRHRRGASLCDVVLGRLSGLGDTLVTV